MSSNNPSIANSENDKELFCTACSALVDSQHYKSEWHRFNVKRKCAGFSPIPLDFFLEQQGNEEEYSSIGEDQIFKCIPCNKIFHHAPSYHQHLLTKKHSKTFELLEQSNQEEKVKPSIEIGDQQCIFCRNGYDDVKTLLSHMAHKHSFWIPLINHIVDLNGILNFLREEVMIHHYCIFCHSSHGSVQACHQHMFDKGHSKILFEDDELDIYSKFYDFENNEDGEEDDDSNNTEMNMTTINPEDKAQGHFPITEIGEIQLKNGKIIGHRDYKHIYKQRPIPVSSKPRPPQHLIEGISSQYLSLKLITIDEQTPTHYQKKVKSIMNIRKKKQQNLEKKSNYLMKHFHSDIYYH